MKRILYFFLFFQALQLKAQIPTPKVQWVSEVQQYGQRNTGLWMIPQPRKAAFDSLGNVYTLFSVGDSLRLTTGVFRKSDGYSCVLAKINKSNAAVAWAYPFKTVDSNMSLTDIVITNNNQITALIGHSESGTYRGKAFPGDAPLFSFSTQGDLLWFKSGSGIQELRSVNQRNIGIGYRKGSDTAFSHMKLDSFNGYYAIELNAFGQTTNVQYLGTGGDTRTLMFSKESYLLQVEVSKNSSFRSRQGIYKAVDQRTSPSGGNLGDVITLCYAKNGTLKWVHRADTAAARALNSNFCSDNHGNVYLGLIYKRNCRWLGKSFKLPFAGDPNCAMAILNETTGAVKRFLICDTTSYSAVNYFKLLEGNDNMGVRLRVNGCATSLWPNLADSVKNAGGVVCIQFDFNGNYQRFWQDEQESYSYSGYEATASFLHQPMSKFTSTIYFFGSDITNTTGNAIALGYASLNQRLSGQSTHSKGGLRVYPVPSDGLGWTVESSDGIIAFSICDLTGKVICERVLNSPVSRLSIDMPNHTRSIYLLNVKLANGSTQTQLIQ